MTVMWSMADGSPRINASNRVWCPTYCALPDSACAGPRMAEIMIQVKARPPHFDNDGGVGGGSCRQHEDA